MPLLAAKLLDLRENHGYSQQFVAEYLNMSREGYCNYERAAREPGLDIIIKLCTLYHIKVSDLINIDTFFSFTNQPNTIHTGEKANVMSNNFLISEPDKKEENQFSVCVEKNILHLLKLLSGKNTKIDVTNLTKEDISFLIEYKALNKQEQEELQEFLHFKQYYKKKKEKSKMKKTTEPAGNP